MVCCTCTGKSRQGNELEDEEEEDGLDTILGGRAKAQQRPNRVPEPQAEAVLGALKGMQLSDGELVLPVWSHLLSTQAWGRAHVMSAASTMDLSSLLHAQTSLLPHM